MLTALQRNTFKKLLLNNEIDIRNFDHSEIENIEDVDTVDLSKNSNAFHFASSLSTTDWLQTGMVFPETLNADQAVIMDLFKSLESEFNFVDQKTFSGSPDEDGETLCSSSVFGDGDPLHYAALEVAHKILGLDLDPSYECVYNVTEDPLKRRQLAALLQKAGFTTPAFLGKPIAPSDTQALLDAYKIAKGLTPAAASSVPVVATPTAVLTDVQLNPGLQKANLPSSPENVKFVKMGSEERLLKKHNDGNFSLHDITGKLIQKTEIHSFFTPYKGMLYAPSSSDHVILNHREAPKVYQLSTNKEVELPWNKTLGIQPLPGERKSNVTVGFAILQELTAFDVKNDQAYILYHPAFILQVDLPSGKTVNEFEFKTPNRLVGIQVNNAGSLKLTGTSAWEVTFDPTTKTISPVNDFLSPDQRASHSSGLAIHTVIRSDNENYYVSTKSGLVKINRSTKEQSVVPALTTNTKDGIIATSFGDKVIAYEPERKGKTPLISTEPAFLPGQAIVNYKGETYVAKYEDLKEFPLPALTVVAPSSTTSSSLKLPIVSKTPIADPSTDDCKKFLIETLKELQTSGSTTSDKGQSGKGWKRVKKYKEGAVVCRDFEHTDGIDARIVEAKGHLSIDKLEGLEGPAKSTKPLDR